MSVSIAESDTNGGVNLGDGGAITEDDIDGNEWQGSADIVDVEKAPEVSEVLDDASGPQFELEGGCSRCGGSEPECGVRMTGGLDGRGGFGAVISQPGALLVLVLLQSALSLSLSRQCLLAISVPVGSSPSV